MCDLMIMSNIKRFCKSMWTVLKEDWKDDDDVIGLFKYIYRVKRNKPTMFREDLED